MQKGKWCRIIIANIAVSRFNNFEYYDSAIRCIIFSRSLNRLIWKSPKNKSRRIVLKSCFGKPKCGLTILSETRYNIGKLEKRFSTFFVNTKIGINTGIEAYECREKELVFTETAGNRGKNRGGFPICHFSPVLERDSKDAVATGPYRLRYWNSSRHIAIRPSKTSCNWAIPLAVLKLPLPSKRNPWLH